MSETVDRVGLGAELETAGIAFRELGAADGTTYAVDGRQPGFICWPATFEQAALALATADQLGLKVVPRGGGTQIGLGQPPTGCDLVVSTERLNRIVDYAPANLTVTVEAGVTLAQLQARLAEGNQDLPLEAPQPDRATLGGIIATNTSGPRRFGSGSARDLVIGTRVATTSGMVAHAGGRVVKNVAGYDLNKLYIGSLGTLALAVELTFKVAPRPAARTTVVGSFARIEDLTAAVATIVRSPLMPNAVDLLNASAARRLALTALPDPGRGYLLATLGTAPGLGLARQTSDLARIYRDAGANAVVELPTAESEQFWARVVDQPTEQLGPQGVRAKLAVPLSRVGELVSVMESSVDWLRGPPSVSGRAGSGVLQLVGETSDERLPATAAGLRTLRAFCRQLGGSLVVEECPLSLKALIDVWGDVGSSLAVMQRLKTALDPRATLNPGRFVGGI